MNKRIIAISVFGSSMEKDDNARITNVVKSLEVKNNDVRYVTTDFIHSQKEYREIKVNTKNRCYIHVPSYKKNLSLKRIFSHIVFAVKLKIYLEKLPEIPNVIYCAMPTSTAAYVAGKYCKKHNVRFVIDVIDLWPDSLLPLTAYKKFLSFVTLPWKWFTIQAYKMANIILGESKEYAFEAAKYNPSVPVYPFYLGVDVDKVQDAIVNSDLKIEKAEKEIWIAYGGSLGTSYDFETLIKSVSVLNGKYAYKLWFIGDGVVRGNIEEMSRKYHINVEITGFLPYNKLLSYLSYCDIAVNIFRENTKVVHSYKFNDYVATQCFILNSLEGETAEMIDKYQIGLNFDFKENSLDKVLLDCVSNWDKYKYWKKNNIRLISEVLDKCKIYSRISAILTE